MGPSQPKPCPVTASVQEASPMATAAAGFYVLQRKTTQKRMQASEPMCYIRRKKEATSIRANGLLWVSFSGYWKC